MPALGLSLFLIAVGAILAFAVNVTVTGISITAVGVILMLVGLAGMVLSLLFWTNFAPFGVRGGRVIRRRDVIDVYPDEPYQRLP